MWLVKEVKSMPGYLLGIFLVFLIIPISSLFFHQVPWEMYRTEGLWYTLLVLVTYWICPWLLCIAIIIRRFLFLSFYLVQCLMLGIHCIAYGNYLPFDLQIVRFVLIACMVYIGFLFINKDFLYPFLSKDRRFWRKAKRFEFFFDVQIVNNQTEKKIPAVLLDCSVTGMGIKILDENFRGFIKKCRRGDRFSVLLKRGVVEMKLPVETVWIFHYGEFWKLGLQILNTRQMVDFIADVTGKEQKIRTINNSQSHLLENDVRQTAYVLWMLFITLSFSIPAFASFFY